MQTSVHTVSFLGMSTIGIEVQVQILNGMPAFTIVGLPDKIVAESRERIRAAFFAMGITLPAKRLTVNLAPADVPKEGSHYDLPIALAILAAMDVISSEEVANCVAIGELALNGQISPVLGVLPAAVFTKSQEKVLVCPYKCAQEAAWSGIEAILAPKTLLELVNHFRGEQILPSVSLESLPNIESPDMHGCFSEVKGQLVVKRALEVAAAGGHNVLMIGPPGVGKSLLAARVPGILPPLSSEEALETTMIHSLAGRLGTTSLITQRPYRAPHHSASLASMVGGGSNAKPGEISLAHRGVLFLDELPEFSRATLEALRQPLETGDITISRANNHFTYPARIQLIAAMNPCRCGYLGRPDKECSRAPQCGREYLQKISGPLLDRIDIYVDVPDITVSDFQASAGEPSTSIRERVTRARDIQRIRYGNNRTNSEVRGNALEGYLTDEAKQILLACVEKGKISARGYYRIMKVARTLADLEQCNSIGATHISEALSYRRTI